MARPPQLLRLPHFFTHRDIAAPVDDAVLPTFDPDPGIDGDSFDASGAETVLFYWTATAEDLIAHTIEFEPLFRDGENGIWLRQPTIVIGPRALAEINSLTASVVFFRISSLAGAPGISALKIRVTGGSPERRL